MVRSFTPRVIVVGSGLAGLSCAARLAARTCQVTLVTAGRAGRDGASHRVHALAPWILLTAPWVKGDGPARFAADLLARAEGLHRDGLPEVLASGAHDAATELCELLDLEPLEGGQPALLPGDSHPRGLRCLPRRRSLLLEPLLNRCAAAGVELRERTLAARVLQREGRVAGLVVFDRDRGVVAELPAEAVVLACGGAGAVFPSSTAPRWCRGSALALAADGGVLLHRPSMIQALPVTATPPLYFPTTAALLRGRIRVDGVLLAPQPTLDATTREVGSALQRGASVTLDPAGEETAILPPRVRESAIFRQSGQVPLTLAVHHMIGGVAIDSWGRTSFPGLYACGEAAGGVQGGRRTMGTGLLEARIFALRVAEALEKDMRRLGPAVAGRDTGLPPLPVAATELEARMDALFGPLAAAAPAPLVEAAWREIAAWGLGPADGDLQPALMAGIRRRAGLAILADRIEAEHASARLSVGPEREAV